MENKIIIKLSILSTAFMSRSEARSILVGLEKFKKIILDFDRVPNVGQAFADEFFRVFQSRYPKISIEPINMNETVKFMVGRVEKPNQQ